MVSRMITAMLTISKVMVLVFDNLALLTAALRLTSNYYYIAVITKDHF